MSPTAYISDLIPTAITNGWGPYELDRSNGEIESLDGGILTLNGTPYAKGLGVHANSSLTYFLGGSYSRFESDIGIDDEVGENGSVVFRVLADGVEIFRSGTLTGASDPQLVDLNVAGVQELQLIVDNADGSSAYDHANWADAKLLTTPTQPPVDDGTGPAATLTASNITVAPGGAYTFTVRYDDPSGVDVATIDDTDIRVTGPNGYYQLATRISTTPASNSTPVTATYSIPAPGGGWEIGDNGNYAVNLLAGTVSDSFGNGTAAAALGSFAVNIADTTTVYLSDLTPAASTNGWGPYERDRSNGEQGATDGGTLTINGTTYAKGLGVHATSSLTYNLGGSYSSFQSSIGVDDEVGENGSVVFRVLADGVEIFRSGTLTGASDPQLVDLNVAAVQELQLIVDNADGSSAYDHANWADAKLTSDMEQSLRDDLTDTSSAATSKGEDPYFLPVSLKSELQFALDTYGAVKLEAAGDYSTENSDLILRSNQSLIGSVYTKTPDILVEPGTTNAYVYSVNADIRFPASLVPTKNNSFVRVGDIYANNAVVEGNSFVDIARILANTSGQGYLRNNTFSRSTAHSSSPQLRLIGDGGKNSYGNTFIATNFLSSHGDTAIIENQRDVKFLGIDIEAWDSYALAQESAAINVRNTDRLELTAMNGNGPGWNGTSSRTGLFDIDANEMVLLNGGAGVRDSVTNYFRGGAAKSAFIDTVDYKFVDEVINPYRFDAFKSGESYRLNGAPNPTLTVDQQNELISLLSFEGPQERYDHQDIPDPLGPNWQVGLADRPDSTNYIQSLVDEQGLAQLGEGVFYISSPLVLKKGQGILGSGMDKTVIVAKDPSVDMIVYDDSQYDSRFSTKNALDRLHIMDLTLQGGRNGVLIPSTGNGPQFNDSYTSRVVFRGMSEAGYSFDKIFGYDNNMFEYVYFVDNATGFKQIVEPNASWEEFSYMDKTTFYRCQFVNNGIGMDLQAQRGNHLNNWIDSLFEGNTETAVKMSNNVRSIFVNSEFIDNGGPAISNNRVVTLVNSYLRSSGAPLIDSGFIAESTIFEGAGEAQILPKGSTGNDVYMYQSTSSIPLGTPRDQFFSNSVLEDNPELSGGVVFSSNNVFSDIA